MRNVLALIAATVLLIVVSWLAFVPTESARGCPAALATLTRVREDLPTVRDIDIAEAACRE